MFSNSSEASFSDKIKYTNDVVIFALHMIMKHCIS